MERLILRQFYCLLFAISFLIPQISFSNETTALTKINRRFERQHHRMVKRIEKILKTYSERDLKEMFKEHSINTGNLIDSADLKLEIQRSVESYQSIKTLLKKMTTPDYKNRLKADLDREIQKAGSAELYLKNLDHRLNLNWCGIAHASLGIMALPATAAGLIGMVYLSFWTAPITGAALLIGWSAFSGLSYPVLIKDCKFNPPAETPE